MSPSSMSRLVRASVGSVEILESRRLFHAAIDHALPADEAAAAADHLSAAQVLRAFPQLAGRDLWDASTFNPTNSNNPDEWLYDPHFVEDDRPAAEHVGFNPDVAEPSMLVDALPDFVPLRNWASGSFSPFIDTTENPGRVLVKFANAIGNQGAGPASLFSQSTGTPPVGSGISSWINPDGTQNVLQRIYSYNGSAYSFSRYAPGGRFIYHPAHSHFHMEGYADYRLVQNVGGQPGAQIFRNDGTEAVGEKVGFCLINVSTFTLPGGQPSTSLPGYNASGQPSPGCGFQQGVSVGRADVYGSDYDGQWIDVTGVPNGNYFIAVTADARDAVEESDETNNTMYVSFNLNVNPPTGGIPLDRFDQTANGGPNNTFATATNLGELGVTTEAGLTAHAGVDFDYFKFTATSSGLYNVQLAFTNGNMDLYVYDSNENLLEQSTSDPVSSGSQLLETTPVNFTAGQNYYVLARGGLISGASGSGMSNNYSLRTFVLPTVTPSTPDASAGEVGLESGIIRVARNGPDAQPVNVLFTLGGTATRGVDYNLYLDDVLLPVGTNQVAISTDTSASNLQVRPIADALIESSETVTITAQASSAYVLGSGGTQTVTLADIPPVVLASAFAFETAQSLSFDFSLNVRASLGLDDLLVINTLTSQSVAVASFSYDDVLNRVRFNFESLLADGRYRATLAPSGVTHAAGAPLAAPTVVDFFVLAGDADHNASVNLDDFTALAASFGLAGTFAQGDFDYNGTVDLDDFTVLAAQFGTTLPLARPSAGLGMGLVNGLGMTASAGLFSTTRIVSLASELGI